MVKSKCTFSRFSNHSVREARIPHTPLIVIDSIPTYLENHLSNFNLVWHLVLFLPSYINLHTVFKALFLQYLTSRATDIDHFYRALGPTKVAVPACAPPCLCGCCSPCDRGHRGTSCIVTFGKLNEPTPPEFRLRPPLTHRDTTGR